MIPKRNSNPDKMTFDVSVVKSLLYMVGRNLLRLYP